MAQLHRFVKLNDRFDTQVFTFILPGTLIQQTSPDVLSREFVYGNQKWRVSMMRNEKHLSAYLTLNNACEGLTCTMDFSFTMINSEHFTRNDMYIERGCKFTVDKSMHGRRTFIGITDLQNRGFLHFGRHFVVELEVRNARNIFEQVLQLPREGKESESVHYSYPRYETLYFSWGLFDWNLSVYPFGDCPETDSFSLVYLTRQTSFDHLCRVRYRIVLGRGDRCIESDVIEQMLDMAGTGTPYESGYSIYSFTTSKGKLPIKIELLHVTAISEVELLPFTRGKNKAHLYDRDKQAWMLEADVSLACLRARIYYIDVYNVPRKFMRFMCWSMNVIPTRGHTKRRLQALSAPFCNYYVQTDTDEGFDMITEIPVEELKDTKGAFMDEANKTLTLHIEWIDSHLLYHTKYHRLDEVNCRQKHQMWREIMALQAENYALEKQLFSYQQSIAKIGSKSDLPAIDGAADTTSLTEIESTRDRRSPRERDRDLADRDLGQDFDSKSDKSDRSRGRGGSERSHHRKKTRKEKQDKTDKPSKGHKENHVSKNSQYEHVLTNRYDHYDRYEETKDGHYDARSYDDSQHDGYDRYDRYDFRYNDRYDRPSADSFDQDYDGNSLDRESLDHSSNERGSYGRGSYDRGSYDRY